jgi:hypothetical protein
MASSPADEGGRSGRKDAPGPDPAGTREGSGDAAGAFFDPDEAVPLPIDGCLDLHGFSPKDLRTLIPDYLDECLARGIVALRIVHGKGTGNVRRSVHALLDRDPRVVHYRLAPPERGGWGATLVDLRLPSGAATPAAPGSAGGSAPPGS